MLEVQITQTRHPLSISDGKVIILEQNVLVMNKSQTENKVYAFYAVFRADVNDVKPFQNPTETSPFDHFLDPQSIPRLFKTINR